MENRRREENRWITEAEKNIANAWRTEADKKMGIAWRTEEEQKIANAEAENGEHVVPNRNNLSFQSATRSILCPLADIDSTGLPDFLSANITSRAHQYLMREKKN
jgi:hypothetical protein